MEYSAGPKVPSERSPDLPSQGGMSVAQKARVNPGPISLGSESNLPLKRYQNINEPASNDSAKNEQQIPKKKIMRSLRDFPYELIYYSWYRDENNRIFRKILIEFGIKNIHNRFVKLLFAAAEIIRHLDPDERNFLHMINRFYNEYIKDIANESKPTLEQFDDY